MQSAIAQRGIVTGVRAIRQTTVALIGIWGAAVWIALAAPDLISGSEGEHIPIASFTIWFYAGLATAFVLTASAVRQHRAGDSTSSAGWWTALVWVAVAIAAIFGPELVTGTDPTQIPVSVLVAPVVGMVTTGFIAILEAGRE